MKLSPRDQWLVTVLPALLTSIIYIFGSGAKASQSLKDARAQSVKASEAIVAPQVLSSKLRTASELNAKLDAQQDIAAKLSNDAKLLAVKHGGNRTETLRIISEILTQKNLSLLKSLRLADSPQNDALASGTHLKSIAERLGLQAPEYWRLEIAGTYQNMMEAINALDKNAAFIVPLSIGMEPLDEDSGMQSWSLNIWI